jgi:ferredoxin
MSASVGSVAFQLVVEFAAGHRRSRRAAAARRTLSRDDRTNALKVHVSRDCAAHGQCNWINPEIFPLDDDGYSAVEDALVPDGAQEDARRAAAACPAAAISTEAS